jgi:hypothetical protein
MVNLLIAKHLLTFSSKRNIIARRPHQGLEQDSPIGMLPASQQGSVRCRKVLGGIIRDYYREAA